MADSNTVFTGEELKEIYYQIEEILRNIFESIRTEKLSFAEAAQRQLDSIDCLFAERNNNNLKQIYEFIRRLIQQSTIKSNNHLLFSEKAIQEIEYLVGSIKYLLRCLSDVTTTGNPTLTKYITETSKSLEESSRKFSLEHEERLIAGLCQPQTAPVYRNILESLKGLCCCIRAISQDIARA